MAIGEPASMMATHYEVLGLPSSLDSAGALTPQLLKAAYRRALLLHHPDKVQQIVALDGAPERTSQRNSSSNYTVDQITKAYSVISAPKLRAQYDRELALQSQKTGTYSSQEKDIFRTGIEVVDLDDLEFDDQESLWYRSCRCGDERGFLVREEDLEEAADDGELNVGCKGCSLWLKVLFGVIDADAEAKDISGMKERDDPTERKG
jgi:curved DNA-binding protein CbpA